MNAGLLEGGADVTAKQPGALCFEIDWRLERRERFDYGIGQYVVEAGCKCCIGRTG